MKKGFAWYRSDQWERLLSVSADRKDLEDAYNEWAKNAQSHIDELKQAGVDNEKHEIDVN